MSEVDLSSQPNSTIATNTKQVKPENKKRKRKEKSANKEDIPRKKIQRPNFFFAVQIDQPDVLGKLHAMQEYVKKQDKRLSKAVVPISTAHVTLAVMHLNEDEGDVEKVCNILKEKQSAIRELFGNSRVEILLEGVGNFRQEVVFAKISSGDCLERLSDLSELLVNSCSEFCDAEQKSFKPHVTVMKLSKMHGPRKKKLKKIPSFLYEPFVNMSFGKQSVTSLELLSMLKKKQASGYYYSEYFLQLDDLKRDESNKRSSWSSRDFADCMAVSSITLAMVTLNKAEGFADCLCGSIMKDVKLQFKGKSSELYSVADAEKNCADCR